MTKRRLRREIALALLFKVAALTALYAAFFGPSHKTVMTPAKMTTFLTDEGRSAR